MALQKTSAENGLEPEELTAIRNFLKKTKAIRNNTGKYLIEQKEMTWGENPSFHLNPNQNSGIRAAVGFFVLGTPILTLLFWTVFSWKNHRHVLYKSFLLGLKGATLLSVFYLSLPIFFAILHILRYGSRPTRRFMEGFPFAHKFASAGLIALGILTLTNKLLKLENDHYGFWTDTAHNLAIWFFATVCLVPFLGKILTRGSDSHGISTRFRNLKNNLPGMVSRFLSQKKWKSKINQNEFIGHRSENNTPPYALPLKVVLGRSTGVLSRLWHTMGLASNTQVILNAKDSAQNLLVLGGIGSGKTTRIMQPLLAQFLDQGVGGLLFDVKGDVKAAANKLSIATGRKIITIGPGQTKMNLLQGLSPEVASSFLKSAFLLGSGQAIDSFWIDTATELCRNTLGLLSFTKTHYTLEGLYNYLFDEEERIKIQEEISQARINFEETAEKTEKEGTKKKEKKEKLLKTYQRYHGMIFETFDEKVKSGVKATIAQVLSPFSHPDLLEAFCSQGAKEDGEYKNQENEPGSEHRHETKNEKREKRKKSNEIKLNSILDGQVYLVDMPLSQWGIGAKVIYTFIKLKFFNTMQARNQNPEWNQTNPVFFMCDEYQELISANRDGLSDLNFWDKSRSSKTIGIISAQSVSSFYASLGSKELTNAVLQNFRQKICFRTEDVATIDLMDSIIGKVRITKRTISRTSGDSGQPMAIPTSHDSGSESISESRESVLDATLFRELGPNNAIALLSIDGHSMDDVLKLEPLFL